MKYIVFHVEGGLGKNIASTALIPAIKAKYPDRNIIVVSSYPLIFLSNPNVYKAYTLGHTPYFYDNYIKNMDTIVLRKEPYFESNHIMKVTPLVETWFNMYDLPYDTSKNLPQIYTNMIQKSYVNMWDRQKPVLLLHTNGGPFSEELQPAQYVWTRDMPPYVAEKISKHAIDLNYHVIQVCRGNSYKISGAEVICKELSNFELFSLLLQSKKRLLIDSCLQHAAVAFNTPSTVLWVGTTPNMFGYNLHNNIIANQPTINTKLVTSYLFDYDFNGIPYQCPYEDISQIFNIDNIIENLSL